MKWLEWARLLQAISQTGLHYAHSEYDKERYEQVRKIATEILTEYTSLSENEILQLHASDFGYATPKVDVRGVVFKDSKILLVKEMVDDGKWTLPGGWADVNESPSQAVTREIFEESGFETRVVKLFAVYDREKQGHTPPLPYHVYKLFFHCEIVGGEPRGNHETGGVEFFGEDEIPELSDARTKKSQLIKFFEYYRRPDLPTDFD